MNLKNFVGVYKKHICPYPVLLVLPAYDRFYKKYLKTDLRGIYVLIDDGVWDTFVEEKYWNKGKEGMFRLFKKNSKIIDEFSKKFREVSKEFLKFTKSLDRDYSKLSNKDLLDLYKKYNQKYVGSFIYGECPAETLKEFLEPELNNILLSIVKDRKKLNKIFSLLTIPSKESFVTKEEKDLLEIVALAKEKKDTKSRLKKHILKYNWVPVDYNGDAWTLEDFEERIKVILEYGIDPNKRLMEIEENSVKLKEDQLKAKKEYNIDDETFSLCLETQKCMVLMDLKKEFYSKAHYHVQFLIREIGKRIGLSLTQANYLTPNEVEKALNENKADKKILDDRYKKSVYFAEGFGVWFLDKKEEKEVRKVLDKKHDGDLLDGVCGNPGHVKAKVRVIVENKDFSKFQKGEILVTAYTTPDFVSIMKKASGIVTDRGGVTSHSSIISRELDIPCVVGTNHATKILKDGDLIEINADDGFVKKVKNNK
ncbi:hypothetical protein CEE44_04760 [Candidatus Woesearchaeota archaeon B3_Woes]|nr:MAG: hypothetical protein CEE44_04760 [Candidatus Woesearchaeota archaeon B3_Woes]